MLASILHQLGKKLKCFYLQITSKFEHSEHENQEIFTQQIGKKCIRSKIISHGD